MVLAMPIYYVLFKIQANLFTKLHYNLIVNPVSLKAVQELKLPARVFFVLVRYRKGLYYL